MKLRRPLAVLLLALALLQGLSMAAVHWERGRFLARATAPSPSADRLVVDKGGRLLELYADGRLLRRYPIRLGFEPAGPKRREGDGRTPEGRYRIDGRNPRSPYYLSLRIDYPSPAQRRAARAAGLDPGGDIVIHGIPNWAPWAGPLLRRWDWTRGCVAVDNREMEEIWRLVPDGTPVEIRP